MAFRPAPKGDRSLKQHWPKFRSALFWVHLTLGLAAAVPVFIMCVTGVLMAYQVQIENYIDHRGIESHAPAPGVMRETVPPLTTALTIGKLIEITHKTRGVDPESVTLFRDPSRPVEMELKANSGAVYRDAHSGVVIGASSHQARQFFQQVTVWQTVWHLALGVSGPHQRQFRTLARAANAVALLSLFLGIALWIPRRWRWPNLRAIAFPRWGKPGRARDFNWHNAIGIWSAIPLLIIVWTAMAMSYDWASRLTNWDSDSQAGETHSATLDPNPSQPRPLSLDALLSRAKQQDARWKAITLFVPHDDSSPVHFAIGMKNYTAIGTIAGLMLDRTGNAVYFTPAGAAGISPPTFIRFGHTGEAWGLAGQTIAAVASLGGAILVWTGLALSLRRWRSWQSREAKSLARAAQTSR